MFKKNNIQHGQAGLLGRSAPQLVAEVRRRGPEVARTVRKAKTAAWEKVKKLTTATSKSAPVGCLFVCDVITCCLPVQP